VLCYVDATLQPPNAEDITLTISCGVSVVHPGDQIVCTISVSSNTKPVYIDPNTLAIKSSNSALLSVSPLKPVAFSDADSVFTFDVIIPKTVTQHDSVTISISKNGVTFVELSLDVQPIIPLTGCVLNDWIPVGACVGVCGKGRQMFKRAVKSHSNIKGNTCPIETDSLRLKTEFCDLPPCPARPQVGCVLGAWMKEGLCQGICGVGKQKYVRKILVPSAFGGEACPAESHHRRVKVRDCPLPACPGTTPTTPAAQPTTAPPTSKTAVKASAANRLYGDFTPMYHLILCALSFFVPSPLFLNSFCGC